LGIKAFSLLQNVVRTKLRWYIIGSGADKELIEQQIIEYKLEDNIILLGVQENPYIWMKYCDFYFQPSRFEGKSIAIDEALILQKPILVTNFSTVNDQIQHLVTGYIVNLNAEEIAEGIINMTEDKELRANLTLNLSNRRNSLIDPLNIFIEIIK